MKQIKIILLLILALSIVLGSFTSCDIIEDKLGIDLDSILGGDDNNIDETPGNDDNIGEKPGEDNNTPDEDDNTEEKPDPETCGHYVTTFEGKVNATCNKEGYTGDKVCFKCGTVVVKGEIIPTTDHSYKNGECTVCGEKQVSDNDAVIEAWKAQYNTITIAEALTLCEQFVDSPSTDRYYIIATVKSVDNASYGQLTIEDETGEIMVYGTYSSDGSLKYSQMDVQLKAGDLILIHGTLQNYKGNTKEVQNARLIDHQAGVVVPPSIAPGSTITIAEALALAGSTGANDRFYITATVKTVTKAIYGAMVLVDENGDEISVYGSSNADGTVGYADMEDKPYKGDTVTVYATLQDYNGSKEIKSAWIIEFTHNEINEDDYTDMSIADARDAAKGTLVKVDGVVAAITYANGYIPSGFYLVDNTGSVYVYDRDAAGRVAVGNTVTVAGTKDLWILETEINSASSFGYNGCNQIANAHLLANDEGKSDFDKSWITESTVKEIIDTPFTEDITTTIFKVTALVKKVPGSGFVNYYIDDIDGVTGSYVYTQCNGGDFEWLDAFDGKICTVYLSVINAKSSAAGCIWRFFPVEVVYENYVFDTADTPKFVVDYYGTPSFESSYMPGAKVELNTLVSSELLGFEGATLSYSVSDTAVATILTEDGKTYFESIAAGNVVVTVTGEYNGKTYAEEITITVKETVTYDSMSAGEAAKVENGTEVIVQGIVGSGIANQKGAFYLITADGSIPVRGTNDIMKGLSFGDEVIVKGTKTITKDGGGQIVIDNAVILANYYGAHSYSTDSFIKDKTIEDINALADTPEATVLVYVLTANITKSVTPYSTNYYVDGFLLYSGGGGQYAWLEEYFKDGETSATVTIDLAICDWNAKGLKGCVIAVYNEDGTKTFNPYSFEG